MDSLQDRAGSSVNDSGTCAPSDTRLTQPRSAFDPLLPGLYRLARTLPADQGGQHAYNLIELIENNVMSVKPWGDHPLQQPAEAFRYQIEGLERALAKHRHQ